MALDADIIRIYALLCATHAKVWPWRKRTDTCFAPYSHTK